IRHQWAHAVEGASKEGSMPTSHGLATTCALVVCLIGAQFSGAVSAAGQNGSPRGEASSAPAPNETTDLPQTFAAASPVFRQSTALPPSFVLRDEAFAQDHSVAPAGLQ